nr:DUF4440 domain-containing protein [uncultured Moellerella sp.]
MNNLFKRLHRYETKLHSPLHRKDFAFLQQIIHADFFEFGRSGGETNKQLTLDALLGSDDFTPIFSTDFNFSRLSHQSVLLTYLSYQLDDNQLKIKYTNRSSIWVKISADHWQLRFHQGTPAEPARYLSIE